jgi:phage/plasmid-associated DNA primase
VVTFVSIWSIEMEDNQKKNVTLYLNSNLYDRYVEYCKKEGLMLSRQIEKFIEEQIKNE